MRNSNVKNLTKKNKRPGEDRLPVKTSFHNENLNYCLLLCLLCYCDMGIFNVNGDKIWKSTLLHLPNLFGANLIIKIYCSINSQKKIKQEQYFYYIFIFLGNANCRPFYINLFTAQSSGNIV